MLHLVLVAHRGHGIRIGRAVWSTTPLAHHHAHVLISLPIVALKVVEVRVATFNSGLRHLHALIAAAIILRLLNLL